jgi:hypothetical protein
MVKVHNSVVDESLLQEFPEHLPTLMNYAANLVGLPATLAVISVIWPQIIEDHGLVFLAELHPVSNEDRKHGRYIGLTLQEKQHIERITNAISLGQMFYSEKIEILENDKLLNAFGEALKYFWSLRLQLLFPEKEFIVEIGQNIASEEGLVITFYQK